MTDETTIKYLRTDYYEPKILNRLSREEWVKAGYKDINARAKELFTRLLKEHKPEPLEAGVKKGYLRTDKQIHKNQSDSNQRCRQDSNYHSTFFLRFCHCS
jgi:trimethylamine:corrinoid methyltransferase-like protein